MNAGFAKGPFKGKGGALSQWSDCIEAGPERIEEALAARRQRRDEIKRQLRQLSGRITAQWANPPLRLVYARGQGWVWRKRASRPGDETLIASLAQPQAIMLLEQLDPMTRREYLKLEQRRLDLNTSWLLLGYEIRTLETWAGRRMAVQKQLAPKTAKEVSAG